MPVERQVVNPRVTTVGLSLGLDYRGVEIGDWFIVRSNTFKAVIQRSIGRSPIACLWRLDWTEIEPHVWRAERVA